MIIKSNEINKANGFNMSPEFHMKKRKEEIKEILNKIVNVKNMTGNNGRGILNQFLIRGNNFTLFQSYNSPIALKIDGKVYIFKDWDYSTTTSKYRNIFLYETKKETLKKLKSGKYIAVDFEI